MCVIKGKNRKDFASCTPGGHRNGSCVISMPLNPEDGLAVTRQCIYQSTNIMGLEILGYLWETLVQQQG